jgi:hypothetical protein
MKSEGNERPESAYKKTRQFGGIQNRTMLKKRASKATSKKLQNSSNLKTLHPSFRKLVFFAREQSHTEKTTVT